MAITPPGFLGATFPPTRWQAWVTCAGALITLILLANLTRSRVGRSWRAVRDDEVAAALSGLNVARLQILAFVVSAACAGLGGALLAVVTGIVAPGAYTLTLSIALLTGAVLGGLGTLPGALWGSLVLVLVPTYPHQRRRQSRPVRGGELQRPHRRLRRHPHRRDARVSLWHPGRAAPLLRSRHGCTPDRAAPAYAGQRTPGRRPHMKRSHRVNAVALAGITAIAMVIAACSSGGRLTSSSSSSALTASAPGITANQILIGSHQPLTGVAAPGYDEIAPASNAYFQYVNAHGGIYGRKIVYKYLNDQYDPTITSTVVHQLVLQDNVFAIFDGLGTPTHLAVVKYLNSSKMPDVFVASGCACWNDTSAEPYTTGWQIDYIREGKILGNYIKQHFAGKKIGYFYQDDEFGMDGVKGLDDEIPSSQVVARESYNPAVTNVAPQVTALKAAGAQVVVSFSVPAFTALLKLNSLKLSFSPQLVVSNVGSDPITLAGLLESYAKQGGATVSGNQLTQGIITDGYTPSLGDTVTAGSSCSRRSTPVPAEAAAGRQRGLWHGGRLHVRPGHVQGRAQPDPAGPDQRDQRRPAAGTSVAPWAYSATSHAGATGAYIGVIKNGVIVQTGPVQVTDDSSGGAITTFSTTQPAAPASGIPSP